MTHTFNFLSLRVMAWESTGQVSVSEDTDGIYRSDMCSWWCWCRLKPALCSSCFFLFSSWGANLGPILSVSLSNIPTQRPKSHKESSSRPAPLQTQEIVTPVKLGHMATDDNALNSWCPTNYSGVVLSGNIEEHSAMILTLSAVSVGRELATVRVGNSHFMLHQQMTSVRLLVKCTGVGVITLILERDHPGHWFSKTWSAISKGLVARADYQPSPFSDPLRAKEGQEHSVSSWMSENRRLRGIF